MTYDASNRKDIRRAEKAAAQLEADQLLFLRGMMDIVQGRRWLYHHLAECQVFVDTPTFEPNKDYFMAGRRSIGLPLMAILQTNCPDQYMQMIKEENDRLATAAASQRPGSPIADGGDPGRELDDTSRDDDGYIGVHDE